MAKLATKKVEVEFGQVPRLAGGGSVPAAGLWMKRSHFSR